METRQLLSSFLVAALIIAGCAKAEPPKNENTTPPIECDSDTGCGVGGCSGQVCTTIGHASGLFTSCEYKPEYGCLGLTSCGCVEGRCMWEETQAYKGCLDNLTQQ